MEFSGPTAKADFCYRSKSTSQEVHVWIFIMAPVINSLCHKAFWRVQCIAIYIDSCHYVKCILFFCLSHTACDGFTQEFLF